MMRHKRRSFASWKTGLTGTSRATGTRDLQDLVEKQALVRTGTLMSTRYHLSITLKLLT